MAGERNLQILTRFSDTASFLYVEHAVIERSDQGIAVHQNGEVISVPAASISTLVLGPGTRITHAAIMAVADCGASVIWSGEELQRFYASGAGKTRSAHNLLKQAAAWASPETRMEVISRMYRFRFIETLPEGLTLAQVRGREGVRVREAYARASREHGVPWSGRNYDRRQWQASDPVNRALSAGATVLYGVCHSAIVAAGFSAGIGFIHTGKQLSFVYDAADLYKVELLVPAAFAAARDNPGQPERVARKLLRSEIYRAKLMDRLMEDLARLFEKLEDKEEPSAAVSYDIEDSPGELWDPSGPVSGGVSHARDDA